MRVYEQNAGANREAGLAQVVAALAVGEMAVLIDESSNSADLVTAGQGVTADSVNFFAREGRGLVCLALAAAQVDRLQLRPMATGWQAPRKPFTVSVDARAGITTGISAEERAHTIRVAVNPDAHPDDLVVPGHVFPLRAGADARTDAAVALVQLAGRGVGAALCELLDGDGELGDAGFARGFARRHGLPWVGLGTVTARMRRPPARLHERERRARDLWREALALSHPTAAWSGGGAL